MKIITLLSITTLLLISCESNKIKLLSLDIDNTTIESIEIIKVKHPLASDTVNHIILSAKQQAEFLNDLNKIKYKGLSKCMPRYIVQIKLSDQSITLKVCGNSISNVNNDKYYALQNDEDIVQKYFQPKEHKEKESNQVIRKSHQLLTSVNLL